MRNNPIKDEEINQRVEQTATTLDRRRLQGFEALKLLQTNQNFALEKEQARLTQKYGENHPRVQAIATRLTYNQQFFPALDREIERTQVNVPPINEKTWRIHGRVLNRDNIGIPGLTLSLRDQDDRWIRHLGYACTNELGYFAITYTFEPNQKPPVAEAQPLILVVSNRDRQVIHQETRPTYLKPGVSDERLIILGDLTPPCDAPPSNGNGDDGTTDPPNQPVKVITLQGPNQLTVDQAGTFTAQVNSDATPPIAYLWDFGDGTQATTLTATHQYTTPNSYTITFTASNPTPDIKSLKVTVAPQANPPTILRIKANTKRPLIYAPIRLSADVTGELPLTYCWNLGDGTTSAEETLVHRYLEARLYTITITVTSRAGTASKSAQLNVSELEPDTWVVYGQIVNQAEQPQSNLTVKLYDQDHLYNDLLGNTTTDTKGRFVFYYQARDFQELLDCQPDVYIEVYDQNQELIYSSEDFIRCNAGQIEELNITIPEGDPSKGI